MPDAEYLPTWHEARKNGQLGQHEQAAAEKAAVHADTPTVAHTDSLGRNFLTIAHNRFERAGAIVEENYPTRVVLDIEGNQREVIDARDRIVMRYDYDIAGPEEDENTANNRIHQASMEAGERWMLNDVAGKPIYAWDSRNHQFHTTYDQLRRPVETSLRESAGPERLIGRTVYGETRPNPEASNLRGQGRSALRSGRRRHQRRLRLQGQPAESQRQLAREYKNYARFGRRIACRLKPRSTRSSTAYDALNRSVTVHRRRTTASIRPSYNEANLLEKVDVNLRGAAVATPFITDIDYNAKGQRTLIDYGNGVRTDLRIRPADLPTRTPEDATGRRAVAGSPLHL